MSEPQYGPVEFYVVLLDQPLPCPEVMDAIVQLTQVGTIRLLDMVVATADEDGNIDLVEVTDEVVTTAGIPAELAIRGLIGDEDVALALADVPAGTTVAVVAFELLWALELAQKLAKSGGIVIRSERISARAVNEVVELAMMDAEE